MFQRPHFQILKNRLLEPRSFVQVLAGPRQVGKTTLAEQLLADTRSPSHFAAADAAANGGLAWIDQQWEVARQKYRASGAQDFILVIDEVQKIPKWSDVVKANWDADTRQKIAIKLVLLGSSRLLLQDGLTESLAGRFETTYIGHWGYPEMNAAFGFTAEQYVWFGGYPGAAWLINDEHRWKKYVGDALIDPSISRDILSLSRVDKPALLRRLFDLGCMYSGQILSYNKMLGQLLDAGNTTTLAFYLELLDSAALLGGLKKYAGNRLRQRQSSPKFQVHNNALLSARHPANFDEIITQPENWGRLVESAVGAHLINAARTDGFELTYWREGNFEVDFVLQYRGKTIALEVKSGGMQGLSGMSAFQKAFSPDKVLLIGSTGLPWQDFLSMRPIDLF